MIITAEGPKKKPCWPEPRTRFSARTGLPSAGVDAAGLEDLPHGRRCDLYAESGQFAVDPAISPAGVLAGQPPGPVPGCCAGSPAGPAARGPGGPAAADDV